MDRLKACGDDPRQVSDRPHRSSREPDEIERVAAFGQREDRVDARETELAELEDRLRRKEEHLARHVGYVQAQLAQRG